MPRNYVKKKTSMKYSPEDLERAVEAVKNKSLTYRAAEEHYNVPLSVIFHRIKGRKVAVGRMGAGRSPALPDDVEQDIVQSLIARAEMGYPCDKDELRNLVCQFVTTNSLSTPFKDNKPGEDWYYSFMKRLPTLSLKKPEHLQKVRKLARKPEIIYDFYDKLKMVIVNNQLDLPGRDSFVFNADESGFHTDPSRIRAIGLKGKPLSRVSGGSGRESTTVLACISADGAYLPPLIVFKGGAVQVRWVSNRNFPGTLYAASTNGWMDEPQFFRWFSEGFLQHVKTLREANNLPNQTALLLYDGHASHISVRIIETAMQNSIQILRLPSHLTDRLQPLDKCVFGPVKTKWEKALVEYGKTQMGKASGRLPKSNFAELLGDIWPKALLPANIISGFVTCGIYPVDATRFPEEFFEADELKAYKEKDLAKKTAVQLNSTPSNFPSEDVRSAGDVASTPTTSSSISEIQADNTSSNSNTGTSTPTSILEIFASKLSNGTNLQPIASKNSNAPVPRLTQSAYGEVLTSDAVLQKLKKVEGERAAKLAKQQGAKEAREKKKAENQKLQSGQKQKAKKRKVAEEKNDSEANHNQLSENDISEEELQKLLNESDDDIDVADVIEDVMEDVPYESPIFSDIKPGVYVLVDFLGGARKTVHYKYVCFVQSVDDDDGDITVTGLNRANSAGNEFFMNDQDVSEISFEMVLAILPMPKVEFRERKLVYVFPGSVNVFEKP